MQRRSIVGVAVGLGAIVAIVLIYDALVETDEERIEVFANTVTSEVSTAKIDAALAWCDPARQPVEVYVLGESHLYQAPAELRERARNGMRLFMGQELRALSQNVEVDGDRASLRLRVMNGQLGMVNAAFEFRKRDTGWLLSSVRITR